VVTEIERFLMQEREGELGGEDRGISVDEFFDALHDGGEGEWCDSSITLLVS
jgi:hypothetical protein